MIPRLPLVLLTSALVLGCGPAARSAGLPPDFEGALSADYPSLEAFYKDLHLHPELSLMEERTAARVAGELRSAGYEVTEKFAGTGVVAVLRNGPGPVLLIRADMDALPVREATGLPYASTVTTKNLSGKEVPVMHACGHDIHMTVLVGTARRMAAMKDRWSGTLVLIGQPAEEIVTGARNMLSAGLYRKFPTPSYAICLHDDAVNAAGTVGFPEGFVTSTSDSVDITVHGVGGHGSRPDMTKDPVVLASQIVLALQTIVSREIKPGETAVVTVGTISGGNKRNIIPDEVKLELTVRSYTEVVRQRLLGAIKRIAKGQAEAAGIPEDLLPTVVVLEGETTPATYNDPALTARVRAAVLGAVGAARVVPSEPVTGSEDFSQFGRTVERVPICFFRLGATSPELLAESERTGVPVPFLHSSKFAPVPGPTLRTGITAMSAAALDLLAKN